MAEYDIAEAGGRLTISGIYVNTLDIEGFAQMMKDPSYCYKFYWLEAIVNLISRNVKETTFDEIIDEMVANAWYSVREFHIHLSGVQADEDSACFFYEQRRRDEQDGGVSDDGGENIGVCKGEIEKTRVLFENRLEENAYCKYCLKECRFEKLFTIYLLICLDLFCPVMLEFVKRYFIQGFCVFLLFRESA